MRDLVVELNHLWVHEPEEPIRALPTFSQLTAEYLPELRAPDRDGVQVLRTAFAYVDEVMTADWTRVMEAAYGGYLARQREAASGSAPSA